MPNEKKILKAIRRNDGIGWELLFKKYDPLIKSIVRWPKWRFSSDEQDDVRQNIHMNLQSAIPEFKQRSSLSWFIKRIAINQCINEVRRQSRWNTILAPASWQESLGNWIDIEFACPNTLDPHKDTVQNERIKSLHSALNNMQKICKESIHMFYMHDLSYKEMSEELGVAVNTIGSRLSKCLYKLKMELIKKSQFKRNY